MPSGFIGNDYQLKNFIESSVRCGNIYIIKNIKMEADPIFQQIQALRNSLSSSIGHKNIETLSFHEYNFQNITDNQLKYLNNLETCHEKAPAQNKIVKKLIVDSQINQNSIFSFGAEIASFLDLSLKNNQGAENLIVSHSHYCSQSVLLAYYLQRNGHNVRILSSQKQIHKGWTNSLVMNSQADKDSEVYALLKAQGIGLTYFESSIDKIQMQNKQDVITIIDVFNLHPTIYRPYIFKEIKIDHRVIFYSSSVQMEQMTNLVKTLPTSPAFQILEVCEHFPIEIAAKKRIQDQIISFLHEQTSSPSKQDIIIFHNTHPNYYNHLIHVFRKQNPEFLKHLNYLTGPNQSQKLGIIQGAGESKLTSSTITSNISNQEAFIPNQIYPCNNIFIAPNYQTLISWNYDLSRVFYVFDFQKDQTFHYSYDDMLYNEATYTYTSLREHLLRLSIVGVNRIGKYCSVFNGEIEDQNQNNWYLEDRKVVDIGRYILLMLRDPINYDHFKEEIKLQRIKRCLEALKHAKLIQIKDEKYKIIRNDVLEILEKLPNVNPILLSIIIDYKNRNYAQEVTAQIEKKCKIMAQLVTYASSVLLTPENLRLISETSKHNNISDRPSALWRQTGYLHSAIDAIVRYKIIENRNNAMSSHMINTSKRLTSKQNLSKITSEEYDIFGDLFEVVQAKKITFDEMSLQDLMKEQFINESTLHKIMNEIENICEVLELDEYEFTKFEEINDVIQALCSKTDRGYGIFSGSRRFGYLLKNRNTGIFPSKTSLIHLLNERPQFLYITRITENVEIDGVKKPQIKMCNHLNEISYMEIFGELPSHKKSSYGEFQIEFHGISSAAFSILWRNNGADMISFEQKHDCLIEFNQEMALVSIHCPKQTSRLIKDEFEKILEKVKNDLVASTKIVNYFGNTSVVLGSGGALLQVSKDSFINKCLLDNLNLYVEESDLRQLFEEFFTIKSIMINEPDENSKAYYKSAIIEFVSQKDYYRFYDYYNECVYMDRYLKVSPIQSKPEKTTLAEQMSIQFQWFVWKSQGKAMVEFQTEQSAKKCQEVMKTKKICQKAVKVELKEKKVFFEDLDENADEIILELAIKEFGKIVNIEMMKVPVKESLNYEDNLIAQIKKLFQEEIVFEVKAIRKLKNGLRKCNVVFNNVNHINTVLTELNRKTQIIGVGKVHLTSWFTNPVIISKGYLHLYEQLINEALAKMPANHNVKLQHQILQQNEYIVTKSTKKQQIAVFKQEVNKQLTGYHVQLTSLEANIVLTDIGIQNLLQIQEKYSCKLLPNFQDKTLSVLTKFKSLNRIKEQIKARVNDKFFYRISLNQKAFKHFKENPEAYQCMEKQYHLSLIQLEEVGRNILIEGNAHHVQGAFNFLMHAIQSVSKVQEQMVNADCCGICCQQPFRPYRLQKCGHKFCMQCLIQNISSTLGDISMFPIKCPQCLAELVIEDLNRLLDTNLWPKLITMAVNQYVGKNSDTLTNCYTAGCKQISFIISDYFKCDSCGQGYCIECKMNYHPGMTCEQAKQGGNAAFQKYMKQNNIRRCPNDKCKMPIQRIDGCYRLTCSRCGKSMCFKCEPEKMIAYDNYNDCYKHLSEVHGGYF